MSALPVVSFLSVVSLGALAAGPRIRSDVAQLALVLWLLVCNLIQGIDSLIWAGNTDIHVPRWCDLVTKILLGLMVAIPGACICIAIKLARIHQDEKRKASMKWVPYAIDGLFCLGVPVAYMCLHFIVQDHRFNIAENFGCSASIYPTNEALALMLVPPMLLGSAAFFICTRAFHNFSRSLQSFDAHRSASTRSSYPDFSRRVSMVMIFASVTAIITMFGIFVRSDIVPWDDVHRDLTVIAILKSDVDLVPVEFAWWTVNSLSWLYIALSLAMGEDIRDAVKKFPNYVASLVKRFKSIEPRLPRQPVLPVHRKRTTGPAPSSMIVEPDESLVSGWDDIIDLKTTRQASKSPSPSRTRSPTSTLRSITTSPVNLPLSQLSSPSSARSWKTSDEETVHLHSSVSSSNSGRFPDATCGDDPFAASTTEYLHSPTAHSLGLQSPIVSHEMCDSPTKAGSPSKPVKLSVPQTVPDDVQSTISSIFDAPWPQPPCTPPPFTSRVGHESPAVSDTIYGQHDGPFETVRNYALPFQGPSIRPIPVGKDIARTGSPTLGKARKYLRRDGGIHSPPNEVVYVTVVKQTV
ncbi:pheromone A receptor-domain-containing protein [Rhodocollybia butyracea]|uniref:Pheromone A receptor-domain-containing protein n=1 Tax=Rhodocollybia butyracea TaxID=206335 RepID=A0A9P5PKH5_9AGAR|nr:pheromone A receptor-domain-containing protein [Rhodocollybia butyracea]